MRTSCVRQTPSTPVHPAAAAARHNAAGQQGHYHSQPLFLPLLLHPGTRVCTCHHPLPGSLTERAPTCVSSNSGLYVSPRQPISFSFDSASAAWAPAATAGRGASHPLEGAVPQKRTTGMGSHGAAVIWCEFTAHCRAFLNLLGPAIGPAHLWQLPEGRVSPPSWRQRPTCRDPDRIEAQCVGGEQGFRQGRVGGEYAVVYTTFAWFVCLGAHGGVNGCTADGLACPFSLGGPRGTARRYILGWDHSTLQNCQ